MASSLTFRRRILRVALATAGAAALCPVLWWHATVLPLGERRPDAVNACYLILAAMGVFVAVGLVRAVRERLVLGPEALTIHGLLRKRTVRWESVAEVAAPWGLYADVPLRLTLRARGRGLLARLLRRRIVLTGHWAEHERLVREVVARVTGATVNARLRAWLDAPSRVPWPHRAAVLLCLAASAGAAAYALHDALAEGLIGLVPGALVVLAAMASALVGGPMGREARAKPALIVAGAILALGLAPASMPAIIGGHSGWLPLLLAACLGWTGATLVACVPLRLRRGPAAAFYAAALAATVGPAWYYAVREPVPVWSVGPLELADGSLAWSPDGSRLGVHVGAPGTDDDAYLVIARPTRQTWRLLVPDVAEQLYLPNARQAFYLTSRFHRRPDGSLAATRKLWAWDAQSGDPRRVPVSPRLRVAREGLISPDGEQAVFLALDEAADRWRLELLRLSDLAVSHPESALDFSRFAKARWACDGALLLTEQQKGKQGEPCRLALWSLAPSAVRQAHDAAPERFYQVTTGDFWDQYSPDVRWMLAVLSQGARHRALYDLVDVRTRASRRIELSGGPYPHRLAWSPDGQALAYAPCDGRGEAVVRLDLATGATRRVPLTLRGEVISVAISCGGRFAACMVKGERTTRVQVADLATGRLLTLRRPILFQTPIEPAWSPAGQALLVAYYDNPLPPASLVRLCLFDFGAGW